MTAPTNYKSEYQAIAGIFNAGWKQGSPLAYITPILWPGVNSAIPTDANGEQVNHVRFFITNGEAQQISVGAPGANVFRHPGIVSCKIYTKSNLGEIPAKELADKFCAIFRNANTHGIRFDAPYSVIIGQTENGFYQINCFAPFERDSLL